MAAWHNGVCSPQRDTGAPRGQALMGQAAYQSFTHTLHGKGRETSRAERPESSTGDEPAKELLPPSQRRQYFHSVETSDWIPKPSGGFPFWMTHAKAFPPRCSLKAQP